MRGGTFAAAVRRQPDVVRGIIRSEYAEEVLAERLQRRQGCWSQLCDEGRWMDTRGDCSSCQVQVEDSRALRAQIAAEVEQEMPGAAAQAARAEIEQRLHAAVMTRAAAQATRRERQLAERQARQRVVAQRRAEFATAEEVRRAALCADCGLPDAAGLCPACTWRQAAGRAVAVAEGVGLAVMARVDLTDPAAVAEATARCTADTQALLAQQLDRLRVEGAQEVTVGFAAREIAEEIRDQRRESLLGRLARSAEAQAPADLAYATELRSRQHASGALAQAAAERAADEALLHAVEVLRGARAAVVHHPQQTAGTADAHRLTYRWARIVNQGFCPMRAHRDRRAADGGGEDLSACGPGHCLLPPDRRAGPRGNAAGSVGSERHSQC
ncbi:hypothetical protein [Streptomyces sp. TRM75561]|uniref:hypothetical protein n=1 Tax=Streptomyces sp. TRM75561 TaxID=2975269 RepID=UPI00244AFFC2|nr:hypothetical protein [Streptomyces sp. TRM75561]MDH3039193.1 hypothetical protein [Streptomyces sp. TRM75561]